MGDPVISARSLVRVHGSGSATRAVVAGVDLDVDAGELIAIVGPSGSGKSTLLHLLAGFDRPTSGTVTVAGQRLDHGSEAARSRFRSATIGFVFQSFRLVPELDAFQNAMLPVRLGGDARAGRGRVEVLFERLGITGCRRQLPSQLSGGEQQRVAIARALAMEPRVLLADEPTGNLDEATGAEVMQVLRDALTPERAVVVVTHDAALADGAGRILRMRDGALAAC